MHITTREPFTCRRDMAAASMCPHVRNFNATLTERPKKKKRGKARQMAVTVLLKKITGEYVDINITLDIVLG